MYTLKFASQTHNSKEAPPSDSDTSQQKNKRKTKTT